MKVAIYARYSSDLQNEKSTDDQVRECERFVRLNGGTVTAVFADRAMSGASRFREQYQALLAALPLHQFDCIVAEALDRLSRDQEDLAALYKLCMFHEVRLMTLAEGDISELHVGLKGTMNALFLKDLAQKTRRGLEGVVRAGKSAGGRIYGYDNVKSFDEKGEPITGQVTINPFEAGIVQRIFEEFADGKSPRHIARGLNEDGIAGPRGQWMDTAIRGHIKRGVGILNNERYIGRLIWNRQRFVKDPRTGKRVSRLNPEHEWIIQDAPHLRIISDNLWKSVKARQDMIAYTAGARCPKNALTGARRDKYLLSGLLICGECGGGYTLVASNRYGCSNRKNRGTCRNGKTIKRQDLEKRVLSGLEHKLLEPGFLKSFVDEYIAQLEELEKASQKDQEAIRAELQKIDRRLQAIMHAIEQGVVTETTKDRLIELETRRKTLSSSLRQEIAVPKPDTRLLDDYRKQVRKLSHVIYDPAIRHAAMDALRPLINKVVLSPTNTDYIKAELYGDMAGLLALEPGSQPFFESESKISVVAGAGFEPTTFRL